MLSNGHSYLTTIQDAVQSDFTTIEIPKRNQLIKNLIYEGQNCMIFARAGAGKTTLAAAIASASSRGGELFGPYNIPKPVGVLYLDGEMPAAEMQERINNLWIKPNPDLFKVMSSELLATQSLKVPNIADQEWRNAFLQFFTKNSEYKLFVIDNLSSLSPACDELSGIDWDPINQWLLQLRRIGLSTILVHHAGKNNEQRGTSKREDQMDLILKLTEIKNHKNTEFRVDFEKARSLPQELRKSFAIECMWRGEDTILIHKVTDEDKLAQIALLASKGLTQNSIANKLSLKQGTVSKRISKARIKGWLTKTNKLTHLGKTYCASMEELMHS